jgi:hypothetical protein
VADPSNPYTPPQSDISVAPTRGDRVHKVFSPGQAGIGTFLGGPLAGTYFVRANFLASGDVRRARSTLMVGIAASILILLALPFLPEKMPGYLIPIAYTIAVRTLVEKLQFTKRQIVESDELTFQSSWRVAAASAIAFVLFAGIAFGEFFVILGLTPTEGLPTP